MSSIKEEAIKSLCDFRDHGNALETELTAEREKVRVLREALEHYRNTIIAGGKNPARHALAIARAEAEIADAVEGVIDGGSITDNFIVVHVRGSPVGYHVGQPVKVILPAIDAVMKEGEK